MSIELLVLFTDAEGNTLKADLRQGEGVTFASVNAEIAEKALAGCNKTRSAAIYKISGRGKGMRLLRLQQFKPKPAKAEEKPKAKPKVKAPAPTS